MSVQRRRALPGDRRRAAVLVVDDDPAKLLALEAVLAPLKQTLVLARSGREALRHMLAREFAVVLLDVRMDMMDGFETAELIRQRPRSQHTPIIFITAFNQAEGDMSRGYALGAVDFVFSPIRPEVLRNKVAVFVELHRKTEEARRQAERLRRLEEREHLRRIERAEAGRIQAEARFATMLDIAADAIIAVDEEQSVILFNKAAEAIFGRSAEEVIGHELSVLIPRGVDDLSGDAAPLAAPSREAREVIGERRDGTTFPAEVSVARSTEGDKVIYTLILRDISERRDAEDRVRRLNAALDQRLHGGVAMVADLAETLEPKEVLGRLLTRVAEAVRADQGTLLRVDPQSLRLVESYQLHGSGLLPQRSQLRRQPLLRRVLEQRRPVVGGPIDRDALPGAAAGWLDRMNSTVVLPLVAGDDVAAVLLLARHSRERFSDEELETLQLIGNVAIIALRNAELFAQAQESSRSKSDFLNLAAHELRTPLSVVAGYVSMLADGTLGESGPRWRGPLEVLRRKVSELNDLVDDLLTAARTEAGTVHSEPTTIDLREAVSDALVRARPRAGLLEAEVSSELPDEPVQVQADGNHLGRILDNLINNALTHTASRPWIRVRVVGGDTCRVEVEDHGPGIPAAHGERIFERFYRIEDNELGPRPGTGLGLYISRALAQGAGGSLRLVRSAPGQGSVFELSLPSG